MRSIRWTGRERHGQARIRAAALRLAPLLLAVASTATPLASCAPPSAEDGDGLDQDIGRTAAALELPADPTLLGYWNFDETSGSNALDTSGNNSHGQLINATRDPSGRS